MTGQANQPRKLTGQKITGSVPNKREQDLAIILCGARAAGRGAAQRLLDDATAA